MFRAPFFHTNSLAHPQEASMSSFLLAAAVTRVVTTVAAAPLRSTPGVIRPVHR